jgi:hypothetical protein
MTPQAPKAFDFGEEPEASPDTTAPRAFDFGDVHDAAPPVPGSPPRALSFDDLPPAPEGLPPKAVARPLFDSDDHPAVRDALSIARADYPLLVEHAEQRLAALFRRLLPVRLALVTDWGEGPLVEQAALLEAALESTKAPSGVFGKFFRRASTPAEFKPALTSAREQLARLIADSEVATRNLEESAQNLSLHAAALAVVSTLAGAALDASVSDALIQRRSLIQQAIRQAELSMLQMGQVRRQAAELIGQVSSFLTVTLPALEMAQAQGSN